MSEIRVYSFLFAMTGILFIGLSIPLIQKRVPPNPYYGFGQQKPRIQGKDLFVAGALITMSSLTMLFVGQVMEIRACYLYLAVCNNPLAHRCFLTWLQSF